MIAGFGGRGVVMDGLARVCDWTGRALANWVVAQSTGTHDADPCTLRLPDFVPPTRHCTAIVGLAGGRHTRGRVSAHTAGACIP